VDANFMNEALNLKRNMILTKAYFQDLEKIYHHYA
jgi:hypothetical protein